MPDNDLNTRFKEAFEIASKMTQADLPQDVQLRLYAYYKQASFGTADNSQNHNSDLRNAFKANAWMQISHLTPDEAKERYIETVNSIIGN